MIRISGQRGADRWSAMVIVVRAKRLRSLRDGGDRPVYDTVIVVPAPAG